MYSIRFEKEIHLTNHAKQRMIERSFNTVLLLDLIELGEIRFKDESKCWIAMKFCYRKDNLISLAISIEDKLVIKTVMHYFSWEVN